MAHVIVDWLFTAAGVANGDGSLAATVQGTTAVAGPGDSALGARASALALRPRASCRATLSPGSVDARRFAVRVLFRATAAVTTRHNLVESNAIPFAMFLEPGQDAQHFNFVDGREVRSVFQTRIQGGVRVSLPDRGDPSRLKIGEIDRLLGPARTFRTLSRQ
jgi:hypothetical protein